MGRRIERLALRAAWWMHRLVWRWSGGRLGSRAVRLPVLELVTVGRRSGERRSVLLGYLSHAEGYVVIASNAGHERPPAWWLNLEANPEAEVRLQGRTEQVWAERLQGEESRSFWRRAARAHPGYEDYARRANRPIPVVLLRRTG